MENFVINMQQNALEGAQIAIEALVINSKPYVRDAPLRISELGTPVMSDLNIQQGGYTDESGVKREFIGLQEDTVLFTVSMSKNIITTSIMGRSGTVKEYISDGDYQINIQGILTGKNGVHPSAKKAQLKAVLDAPIALNINSRYLNDLGIYSIVVTGYEFPQVMGGYSQQVFSINAISDLPVILDLNR
jgi:Domain of unknown function (DUF6046)